MKAYFEEVLQVEFKDEENPADTIIDTCTFESARRLALDGVWKSPPQCLRAVLFPTPEAVHEESDKTPWQPDEFGKMLAALWNDFSVMHAHVIQDMLNGEVESTTSFSSSSSDPSKASASEASSASEMPLVQAFAVQQEPGAGAATSDTTDPDGSLEAEAKAKMDILHWGQQVWIHIKRSLLILSREVWPTVTSHVVLLMIAMKALSWAYPRPGYGRFMLQNGLFLLLLCLAQCVAAQRYFGGEEREVAMREASLSSLSQVLFTFVGKDVASLVEIFLSAAVFTLTFWPDSKTYAHGTDVFETGFALLYCLWGFNHILAIMFRQSIAMQMGIISAFLSFLCSGLKPTGSEVSSAMGGYGVLLLLASPIRWGLSQLITWNVIRGGTYLSPLTIKLGDRLWAERGFSLAKFDCLDDGTISECWKDDSSWAHNSGQLFLLGFLFRFLAVMCLLITSSAHANGGQLPLGSNSITKSRILRDCLMTFLAFLTLLNIALLGSTH